MMVELSKEVVNMMQNTTVDRKKLIQNLENLIFRTKAKYNDLSESDMFMYLAGYLRNDDSADDLKFKEVVDTIENCYDWLEK